MSMHHLQSNIETLVIYKFKEKGIFHKFYQILYPNLPEDSEDGVHKTSSYFKQILF